MGLPLDLLAKLHLTDLATEPLWPSAMVTGAAHYADAPACDVRSPIDGALLGSYAPATIGIAHLAIEAALGAFLKWRTVPVPQRGELVKQIGERVQQRRSALAQLISLESGKTMPEADAEVQWWIDSCELAFSQARQLHGVTLEQTHPNHRTIERWHPLGAVGIISSFRMPIGAWAQHAMMALCCGDSILWKPSSKTPLSAIAAQRLVESVVKSMGEKIPAHVCQLLLGDAAVGHMLAEHPDLPIITLSGRISTGQDVAQTVGNRLGRCLCPQLSGNTFVITPSANIDLVLGAITAAAITHSGQHHLSLRRLIIHEALYKPIITRLSNLFSALKIGDPKHESTHMGPLVNADAWWKMQTVLQAAEQQGGRFIIDGHRLERGVPHGGYYVQPAMVEVASNLPIMSEEALCPILYLSAYTELQDALALHNDEATTLGSTIFTQDISEAEEFIGPSGSTSRFANINTVAMETGKSPADYIDQDAGTDAWKGYMRRIRNTIRY